MISSKQLSDMFFHDLKQYNCTNFRTVERADLSQVPTPPTVYKAFSAVVTRYFIFCERHSELTDTEKRVLYFKLKIDLISQYFMEYPDTDTDRLRAFQIELQNYLKAHREGRLSDESQLASAI